MTRRQTMFATGSGAVSICRGRGCGGIAASLLATVALHGCASADLFAPTITPEEVTVHMSEAGPLPIMQLIVPKCSYISAELRFPRKAFTSNEELDLLVGRGKPIIFKVSILRIDTTSGSDKALVHASWDKPTEGIQGWANSYVFRHVGGVTLPRGRYNVHAVLLEAQPSLGRIPVTFSVASNFKYSADPAAC